ncbi:MAG: TetR/AcrR family transcriptional regulator [Gammaproteobacteria bacterium]|nr:TetR/AcrR family transcriptional regulator [Gammaproteobacteria bacterium]
MDLNQRQTSHRPGTATQSKGQSRLASILDAARAVFINAGYAGLTMRKVADRAGISIGNLNYYYRTKDDLLRDLIDHVIGGYLHVFGKLRDAAGQSPQKQLESILDYWIDDLGTPETTAFFPELWALANHDPHVAELVDGLYARAREPLDEIIGLMNPACTPRERRQLALFMCAAMEGLTVFAGNGKPWASQRAQLKRIAIEDFMQLIGRSGGTGAQTRARQTV